jgi:hypothetical protein
LAFFTTHRTFLDLEWGIIYIFDVIMSKNKQNGKKKAFYSTIGSEGVQNREKRNKIGLNWPEGWLKRLGN